MKKTGNCFNEVGKNGLTEWKYSKSPFSKCDIKYNSVSTKAVVKCKKTTVWKTNYINLY